MHCGISKWSPCCERRLRCPVLCSRPLSLKDSSFLQVIHSCFNLQYGGSVFRQRSVQVRRLSRYERQKIHRSVFVRNVSLRRFSSSRGPRQEVQPRGGGRWRCPRTVCVLSPPSQDRAKDPGTRHEPVSSGDHNQWHGAAGGAGTHSHVLAHAQCARKDTIWHHVVQVKYTALYRLNTRACAQYARGWGFLSCDAVAGSTGWLKQ